MSELEQDDLGSLAQSGRKVELKKARTTLYVIGVLTLVVNIGVAMLADSLVTSNLNKERDQLRQQGMEVDQAAFDQAKEQAVTATQLAAFGFAGLGVAFLVIGACLQMAPLPLAILALILYLGGVAISAMADPTTLAQGIIVKIIIIVALVKAVQTASAYQREAAMA